MVTIDQTTPATIAEISGCFVFEDGETTKTVVMRPSEVDSEWLLKQNTAIDEYEDHHNDGYPPDVLVVCQP